MSDTYPIPRRKNMCDYKKRVSFSPKTTENLDFVPIVGLPHTNEF